MRRLRGGSLLPRRAGLCRPRGGQAGRGVCQGVASGGEGRGGEPSFGESRHRPRPLGVDGRRQDSQGARGRVRGDQPPGGAGRRERRRIRRHGGNNHPRPARHREARAAREDTRHRAARQHGALRRRRRRCCGAEEVPLNLRDQPRAAPVGRAGQRGAVFRRGARTLRCASHEGRRRRLHRRPRGVLQRGPDDAPRAEVGRQQLFRGEVGRPAAHLRERARGRPLHRRDWRPAQGALRRGIRPCGAHWARRTDRGRHGLDRSQPALRRTGEVRHRGGALHTPPTSQPSRRA